MKNYHKKILFLIFLLFFNSKNIFASHIIGGDINLKNIAGNKFTLKLDLYFDALNGNLDAFDSVIVIKIRRKSDNKYIEQFSVKHAQTDTIPTEAGVCSFIKFKTVKHSYSKIITLTNSLYNSAGGFYISWDRCCRNSIIGNISNSSYVSSVFYVELPPLTTVNSSPQFANPTKTVYGCLTTAQTYDFSATDADGDSLVYSIDVPNEFLDTLSTGNNLLTKINLLNRFSKNYILPSNPVISINSATGIVSLTPSEIGVFVLAIKCEEYRKGQYLGCAFREYQLISSNCFTANTSPKLLYLDPLTNKITPTLAGLNFDIYERNCITVVGIDTLGQQLKLEFVLNNSYYSKYYTSTLTVNPTFATTTKLKDTVYFEVYVDRCIYSSKSKDSTYIFDFLLINNNNCSKPDSTTKKLVVPSKTSDVPIPFLSVNLSESVTYPVAVNDTLEIEYITSIDGVSNIYFSYNPSWKIKNSVLINLPNLKKGILTLTPDCYDIGSENTIYISAQNNLIGQCYYSNNNNIVNKNIKYKVTEANATSPKITTNLVNDNITQQVHIGDTLKFNYFVKTSPSYTSTTLSLYTNLNTPDFYKRTNKDYIESSFLYVPTCEDMQQIDNNIYINSNFYHCRNGYKFDDKVINIKILPKNENTIIEVFDPKSNLYSNNNEFKELNQNKKNCFKFKAKSSILDTDLKPEIVFNNSIAKNGFSIWPSSYNFKSKSDSCIFELCIDACSEIINSAFEISLPYNSSCMSLIKTPTKVKLEAMDDSIKIEVSNIITPNGDGKNDVFVIDNFPEDNCLEKFSYFEVYNRWGTKICTINQRPIFWNPENVTDGIYYYVLKYTKRSVKGWIEILR